MTHHAHNIRNCVDNFTRGMSGGTRLFAKHLDQAMKDAVARGDHGIKSTLKELAEDAGLSYATAKRAKALFLERGWIVEGPRRCLIPRWPEAHLQEAHFEPRSDQNEPPKGQNEPAYNEEKKSLHANVHGIHLKSHAPHRGGQCPEIDRHQGRAVAPRRAEELAATLGPEHQQAITLLVEAGMDCPGARSAVSKAIAAGHFDLTWICAVIDATKAKKELENPGGFLYKAISQKEKGDDAIKESFRHKRQKPQPNHRRMEEQTIPTQPHAENAKLRCLNQIASSIENREDLMHAMKKINIPMELLKAFLNTQPSLCHLREFLNDSPASME